MSEYYKQIKEIILKNYKIVGIGIKAESILYIVLAIISGVMAFVFIGGNKKSDTALIVYFLLSIGSYLGYLWCKKRYRREREKAITAVMEYMDIEMIKLLIKEIEDSIRRIKTFATWFIGVTVTFVILFITFFTNYYLKLYDFIVDMGSESQMRAWIIENFSAEKFVETAFHTGGSLLILVIFFLLCFYGMFMAGWIVKKEILLFLYDMQYMIMMEDKKKQMKQTETRNSGDEKGQDWSATVS